MGSRFLLRAVYANATVKKYEKAVSAFLSWCESEGGQVVSVSDLDELLCDFFCHLFDTGMGRALAVDTLYGIFMYVPAWKFSLPSASLSLRGWSKLVPVVSHPPLTWDLTVLIAVQVIREHWSLLALGILLSFDCLLRVSELTNLVMEDIVFPDDRRFGVVSGKSMLRLQVTKTGKNQWVEISNPTLVSWLRFVVARCLPGAKVFPFSSQLVRKVFKAVVLKLCLPPSFVPHSLRHGGATRLHLAGVTLEDIMLRGRWAASKSARIYIQTGKALLLDLRIPAEKLALAAFFSADLEFTLRQLQCEFLNQCPSPRLEATVANKRQCVWPALAPLSGTVQGALK